MNKPLAVVSCPLDTYSGYGARARDFVKALIALDKYEVKTLSQRWGNTRYGYLADHKEDTLTSTIIPKISKKPDLWIQITVPNEFQPVGNYNIGVTAGMETTLVHQNWIEGCNKMDLILTSSKHSLDVFKGTRYEMKGNNSNDIIKTIQLEKPVEILLEGADLNKYFAEPTTAFDLSAVQESFNYLFLGHWMQGDIGQDRKNVGYMIKAFLETFKNKTSQPGLIIKTQQVGSSLIDKERILNKIDQIRNSVKGKLPNIYLVTGDLTDKQINQLYNNPKVKAMVSFTKGEGYGRPLLEFGLTGKPIIASGWSGHTDFLNTDNSVLLAGTLENVHQSAANNWLIEDAKWFQVNPQNAISSLKEVYKHYKKYLTRSRKQKQYVKDNFSWEKMRDLVNNKLNTQVPEFASQVELKLPKLKLPKLNKI